VYYLNQLELLGPEVNMLANNVFLTGQTL